MRDSADSRATWIGKALLVASLVLLSGIGLDGRALAAPVAQDAADAASSAPAPLGPVILSAQPRQAIAGQAYRYAVEAAGDGALRFSLAQAPAGMTLDPDSGLLAWPDPVAGAHPVDIVVEDGLGRQARQPYILTVLDAEAAKPLPPATAAAANQPPQIRSRPPTRVHVGQRYDYQPEAVDPDGEALRFSLATAPRRMRIDPATGAIVWQGAAPKGAYPVELVARDPAGAEARQAWTVQVRLPNVPLYDPPRIVSDPPLAATVDQPYVYPVQAEDPDGDLDRFELVAAPTGLRIDAGSGRIDWTPAQPGPVEVAVAAVDATGRRGEQRFVLTVGTVPGLTPPEWQSPATLTAPLGRTTHFRLLAFDADGEAVSYVVTPLPLPAGMRIDALSGELAFTPSLDQVGAHVLQLSAFDGRFRSAQALTITVPAPDGPTRLSGRVLQGIEVPLPGVRLVIGEEERISDADGEFQFEDLPEAGDVSVLVDGASAQAAGTFATVPKQVHLIAGADNRLDAPIILLPLDTASADAVNPNATSQITSAPVVRGEETFAPVTLTIPPGTARWAATGELYTGSIHITAIPDNRLSPQPLPPGLDFSVYVAIQPFGVVYDVPVPISFPNTNKLLPGTRMEVLGLDHDTGEFVKFGDAEVSADGATVDSIGGVVVANSWHGVVLPQPEAEPEGGDAPDPPSCPVGSQVCLSNGNLNITHSIPSYQSLGRARSVTLSYNHITAHPQPIVPFLQRDAAFSTAGPSINVTKMNIGGVTFTPAFTWEGTAEASRGAIQFDASGCPSEVYDYQLQVTSKIPGTVGNATATLGGKLQLINLTGSPFGAGWHIDGLEWIISGPAGDRMIIDGRSEATLFRPDGLGAYITPDGDFSRLTATEGGYERRFRDGTIKTYDAGGRQIGETDRNDNRTTYSYDSDGRLLEITDPVALKTTFAYFSGRLTRITDPAGRTTRFEHDAFGNLTRIIAPDGAVRSFAYDAPKGRLIAQTDPRGFVTEYRYNAFGRLETAKRPDGSSATARATVQVGMVDPATGNGTETNPAQAVRSENVEALLFDGNGNLTRFKTDRRGEIVERLDAIGRVTRTERDADSNPLRSIRPDGSVATRTFDAHGNVLSQTEQANGATTTWTYDAFDQVTSITDPRGHTTTFERDERGNLIRTVNPLGHVTTMEYNAQGLMTRRVDPNGLETVIEYDAAGLAARITEMPVGDASKARTTSFEYTASGEPSRITSPIGAERTFTYDNKGRPVVIEDHLGQRTDLAYDAAGNLVQTETFDADGTRVAVQEQSFDEEDRLIETRAPHSDGQDSVTQFAYDGEGNRVGTVDPNGRILVREFDAANRLIRSTDPASHPTDFAYDTRNQVIRVATPNQVATSFDFDALSRPTAEHSPDRGTITQDYDLADNLTASTDARGIRREMSYDPLNRLTVVTFPEPGEDITYTYDACPHGIGRVCRIDDESGTLQYEYDAFGNVARTRRTERGVEYVTEYEYDLEDRLTALIYPSGRRVEYQRDSLGRVVAVHAEGAGRVQPILTDLQYRADGQLVAARFGNGLTQTRRYDLQGRLVEQDLFDDGGMILDARRYAYDPGGNLTARTGTPGDQRYAYDALDRLIGQDLAADGKSWQYDYDPNHNRLRRSDGGALNEVYSYQASSNRLVEIDTLLGQIEPDRPRSQRLVYNQASRFAEYIEDGATSATYTYNALGQRTRKTLPDETRVFHYATSIQLLGETDAAGTPIKDYIWLGNEPVAQIEATGVVVYLHTDHLLTPRLGTSDAKAIVWRWEGEAFGDVEAHGPMEVNLRFPGQYFDAETGRHYNYFRDYDPAIGRYLTSDPIGLAGGLNTYAYVFNNPLRWVDPLGLFCTFDFAKHYYTGGSSTIDLGGVGLLGAFQNSASVQGSVNRFKQQVASTAKTEARSLCKNCDKGTKSTSFNLNDRDVTNVTDEPCLFAVGHSTFFRSAGCGVTANCKTRTFSFGCSLGFSIRDWFRDPISLGFETPFGTPYRINGNWSESYSGRGSF